MKYKKRPVVIEAIQYDGTNQGEINHFMQRHTIRTSDDMLIIQTLEGDMTASVGDFIIKGIQGEFYPCKSDIFEETYEAVE